VTYRLSIAERIALTTGFRTSSDIRVLTALASFAHYETGIGAHPSWKKLQSRVPDLSRRTIARRLAVLEEDGWIEGKHVHRWPTTYRICIERLATSATMAKVVVNNATSECQSGTQIRAGECQSGTQIQIDLSATLSNQSATLSDLSAKVALHPDLDLDLDPSAPALRAPGPADGLAAADEDEHAPLAARGESQEAADGPTPLRTGTADLCADGRDHPDAAAIRAPGLRGDQTPASGAGVHVRHQPDSPSAVGGGTPGGADKPLWQPTLGPLDLSVDQRRANLQRLADMLKTGMQPLTPRRDKFG